MAKEGSKEPKYKNFGDLAKGLKKKADASLGYISKGDFITVIPTGSLVLDSITCKGGIPVQRITQIASEPGVGKSTSALSIAASCQRLGGKVLYLDFEQSLTPEYIEAMGCVLDDETMIFAQPVDIDAGWELIDSVSNMGVNLVILDSLASMFPRTDDDEFKNLKTQVGYQAKGLMLFVPRLKTLARVKNFAVLMINQVRAKISFGWGSQYQKSPAYQLELPGGFVPKFYTDLLIYLTLKKTEKESPKSEVYTGHEIMATTWKNKIGVPYRRESMYLTFGKGIDDFRSVIEIGIREGLIDYTPQGGAWSFCSQGDYPGVAAGDVILKGRGRDSVSEAFAGNAEAYMYLRNKLSVTDFITASADADEIESINKLISVETPDMGMPSFPIAPASKFFEAALPPVPAPRMTPPPIPQDILDESVVETSETPEPPAKRPGRPKKV